MILKRIFRKLSRILNVQRKIRFYLNYVFLPSIYVNDIIILFRKHTKDESVINEVFNKDAYIFNKLGLKEDSIVIDIGAQIGCFAVKAAKIAKKGKVYCFEPEPQNFNILKKNVKINKLSNVFYFRKAVTGVQGIVKLFIPCEHAKKQTGEYSIFKFEGRHQNKYLKVQSTSLNSILSDNKIERVDLLKLDCEGAERQILYSASKEVLNAFDRIIFEYHLFANVNQFEECKAHLQENGFKKFEVIRDAKVPELGLAYFTK